MASPTTAGKCAVLKRYAEEGVTVHDQHRHLLRTYWNRERRRLRERNGLCVACSLPTWTQHHIIPLKVGGHPTASQNRVWICEDCHAEVHPWLETPRLLARREAQAREHRPLWG
jgi:5-methylcytosine-specific restriction endonuclease McrA